MSEAVAVSRKVKRAVSSRPPDVGPPPGIPMLAENPSRAEVVAYVRAFRALVRGRSRIPAEVVIRRAREKWDAQIRRAAGIPGAANTV